MTTRTNRRLGWLAVSLLALATPAFADHHEGAAAGSEGKPAKSQKKAASPDERAKMAEAHERIAACLRSTRPMKECRSEMKKAHKDMGHGDECSMDHAEKGEGHDHGTKAPK